MIRSFLRSPGGLISLAGIVIIIVIVIVAPIALEHQASAIDPTQVLKGPSAQHYLGTDQLGRDLLARLLVGTRLSMLLAFGAVAISIGIGIPLGAVSAVLGKRVRQVLLRSIDAMLAFPALIVAIYVGAILGPGNLGPVVGVGIAGSFAFARLASNLVMSVGAAEYVQAARVTGVRGFRLLTRHILPNVIETLLISTTVSISIAIVTIAGLSFLGIGVQPPGYDWGSLLTAGVSEIFTTPAAAVAPAVAIALSAIVFGFFGEAIARATNPLLVHSRGMNWRAGQLAAATSAARPARRGAGRQGQERDPGAVPGQVPGLEVADLSVAFPGRHGPVEVVSGVSFSMRAGERLGIVGESGSGKTMTALAIAQLIPYPGRQGGSISIEGRDLAQIGRDLPRFLSRRLAVVFQDPMSSLNPALTIGRQLTESVTAYKRIKTGDVLRLATTRLAEVRLPVPGKQLHRRPYELSGGMRQRVLIAMGLMNEPQLLIADEPTTALDVTVQAQIMDLLLDINSQRNTGIILISHNLGLIRENCERVLVMYAGRVVEDIPAAALDSPLHPYTRLLLAAVPDVTRPRGEPLIDIPGQVPDPESAVVGCSFRDRCPMAMARCASDDPLLVAHAGGRRVACWAVPEEQK
jgi:peptide/nickel transport system permease protein